MKPIKILCEPLLYLLLLLAVAYIIVTPTRIEFSNVKSTKNDNTEDIKLPYSFKGEKSEEFTVSFNLLVKNTSFAKFNIIPDDCIQEILINGKQFPIDGIKGLCNYSSGAYFDFSKYVQKELNFFEIRVLNHGGVGGLKIQTPYNGFKSLSLMHYIFTLLLLISIVLILRKFEFKFIATSIILLGIIARLIVYTYMGPMQSPYDIGAHFEYINIFAEEKRMPQKNECWECFQPPPYYIASAVVKNIVDNYDPTLTGRVLQQGSLLFSFASIIFGVALILNLFGNNRYAYLASIVSVFWTGFAIAGPRINNDIPFYFGTLFCMLFAQRYWLKHKNSDMFLASLGASIAIASKSTGFVILATWVVIFVLCTVRSLKIGSLRTLLASAFTVLLFIGISNHRTIIDIYAGKKGELLGESNMNATNGQLRVNNAVGNYLYFDLKDYLLIPHTSAWVDEGGRQYFWNYLIKSSLSLYKEWKIYNISDSLCTILCILALLIFVLALWGIINAKFRELPAMLFTVFLISALIYIRIRYPLSAVNECRYIFPVLFPLSYFSMRGAQILENSRLRKFSYIGMLSFAALSFAFIVSQAI